MVLLTLVSDPFAQLLINPRPCQQPATTGNASFPRAQWYNHGTNLIDLGPTNLDLDMQNAIYQGAFGGRADDFKTSPFCPTGNCNFPDLDRLGYCASCRDVSSDIQVLLNYDSQRITSDSKANITYVLLPGDGLPEMTISVDEAAPVGDASSLRLLSEGTSFGVLTGFLKGVPSWVASGGDPDNLPCGSSDNTTWPCRSNGAARCNLVPCVQTLSTHMTNGTLSEVIVDSVDIPDVIGADDPPYYTLARTQCLVANKNSSLVGLGTPLDSGDGWLLFQNSDSASTPPNRVWRNGTDAGDSTPDYLAPECAFSMHSDSIATINGFMISFFNGTLPFSPAYDNDEESPVNDGDPLLQQLYQGANITFEIVNNTFQMMASSVCTMDQISVSLGTRVC